MYASFKSHPARIDTCYREAWVLIRDDWRKLPAFEVLWGAETMFKDEFENYGPLPPLPRHAFTS